MSARDEKWFRTTAAMGDAPIASVIVCGYRAAREEATRLRAMYPAAKITIARDA